MGGKDHRFHWNGSQVVGYVVRNSIAHTFTVGICEIIFVEGEKGIS